MNRTSIAIYRTISIVIPLLVVVPGYAEEIELGDYGFGIEFFTKLDGKRTLTYKDVTFNGRGSGNLAETQTVDLDIDIDYPGYEIALFYRIRKLRLKIGWIPTSSLHNDNHRGIAAKYNQQYGDWPLGLYDIDAQFFNLIYLEMLNLKARNMFVNLALRIDNAKIKGELSTIKYPDGDEWFQAPVVLNQEKINEDFILISVGPKIGYDLKNIDILSKSILSPFKKAGLDISAFYDFSPDYSDLSGYLLNCSLALEF
jgi:hypothetical protein